MIKSALDRCVRKTDGASAVEFALIFPIFVLLVFGLISFGGLFAMLHGLQQLAGEAARASVAGLSEAERRSLAESHVWRNVGSYTLINPEMLTVVARPAGGDRTTFEVIVTYDARDQFMFKFGPWLPLPSTIFERRAAIKQGGY